MNFIFQHAFSCHVCLCSLRFTSYQATMFKESQREYLRYSLKVIQLLLQRNTFILNTYNTNERNCRHILWSKKCHFRPLALWAWTLQGQRRTVAQSVKKLTHVIELPQAALYVLNQCVFPLFVITCGITHGRSCTRLKKIIRMISWVRVYAETIRSLKAHN